MASMPAMVANGRLAFIFFVVYRRRSLPVVDRSGPKRLQKFVYKGMGPVAENQGVVWPSK
jgi:hypothetical protein